MSSLLRCTSSSAKVTELFLLNDGLCSTAQVLTGGFRSSASEPSSLSDDKSSTSSGLNLTASLVRRKPRTPFLRCLRRNVGSRWNCGSVGEAAVTSEFFFWSLYGDGIGRFRSASVGKIISEAAGASVVWWCPKTRDQKEVRGLKVPARSASFGRAET